jgi:putative SOS response-associated peptidase YedK
MCGRFTLDIDERFYPRFKLDKVILDYPANFNIAPGQDTPLIIKSENREVKLMNWGFLPPWGKDLDDKFRPINAKVETIDQKNTFKSALNRQRCLIPANGFYEWEKTDKGKLPWYFYPAASSYFAFAGIYSVWKGRGEDKPFYSYTILTRAANAQVKNVHERMPVILRPTQEEIWLNEVNIANALEVIRIDQNEDIKSHRVAPLVNSPQNNFPELIKPI